MTRRLNLSRETLRTLSGSALAFVAGGQAADPASQASTAVACPQSQAQASSCGTQSATTNAVSAKCVTTHVAAQQQQQAAAAKP